MNADVNPAVYLHKLKLQELKDLIGNQKLLENNAPITTRATFKISQLEDLINQIKKDPSYDANNEDYHHMICITFVRDDVNNPVLGYDRCINAMDIETAGTDKNGKRFTQLVPIITGCDAHLDPVTGRHTTFEFFYFNEEIPYVRSGGEGSGLIPPPPPSINDQGQ